MNELGAIEVIRVYRQLDERLRDDIRLPACDMAIAALEKQTPKKPILMQLKDYEIMCPACGVKEDRRTNCCPNCGQRYDWSD